MAYDLFIVHTSGAVIAFFLRFFRNKLKMKIRDLSNTHRLAYIQRQL